jgi:hypothetical protein
VIHPGGEEGIDAGWVHKLPVIGKDHPEQQDDKLKKKQRKTKPIKTRRQRQHLHRHGQLQHRHQHHQQHHQHQIFVIVSKLCVAL